MATPFTRKTLAFLRALKRNNDREWFRARKDQYEQHVRGPMIAVVERLADDFRIVAPELIASPKQSLFRIYLRTGEVAKVLSLNPGVPAELEGLAVRRTPALRS